MTKEADFDAISRARLMMNDVPRQRLCELIAHYGESVCDEPLRVEALLRDLCPKDRGTVNLLINALREGVATDLRNQTVSIPIELTMSRLTKRCREHLMLSEEIARWAVESWALALGKISESDLTEQPRSSSAPLQTRSPASRPQISVPLKRPSAAEKIPSPETASERRLRKLTWALVLSVAAFVAGFAALWYFAIFLPQQRTPRVAVQSATPVPAAVVQATPAPTLAPTASVAAPTVAPPAVAALSAAAASSEPEVRKAKPVTKEELSQAGAVTNSPPPESGEQNRVAIQPLKRTYVRVTLGDEAKAAFERWVSPTDGPVEFRGKHVSIRVLDPEAVKITKNGEALEQNDQDVTVN